MTEFSQLPEVLELLLGSAGTFEVFLFDQNDEPEDLSAVDDAILTIKDGTSEGAEVLLELKKSSSPTDIIVSTANSKLTCIVNQAEADALDDGLFPCDVALHFSPSNIWKHTDAFLVRIRRTISAHA